jgi:hypothetical protein
MISREDLWLFKIALTKKTAFARRQALWSEGDFKI